MIISRNVRLLGATGAAIAAAATGAAPALIGALAAVSLVDVLLGAVGIVVAIMTALAGLLVISDLRMDVAAARTWQDAASGLTAAVSAAAEASGDSHERMASDARAEMVRRILIAHRFDRPHTAPQQMTPGEPRQGAHVLDAVRSMEDARSTASSTEASVCVDEPLIDLTGVVPDRALRLVASRVGRPMETAVPAKRLAKGIAASSKGRRLVVIGGPSPFWSQPHAIVAADELVATDGRHERRSPDQNQDSATDGTMTEQPACRGPPNNSGRIALRKKHRPPSEVSGKMVVVHDFGERVPICAPELDVIEAYLDDVLRDVLGGRRADRGSDTT